MLMKQFKPFSAYAPTDFRDKMLQYWVEEEGVKVMLTYADASFDALCNRISGTYCDFIPDLGYTNEDINGTLCFEVEDNNFVIPIKILEEEDK